MENSDSFHDREGSVASSGGSTPEPPIPFFPKFSVLFTDKVTKDGDSVKFMVQVSQNGTVIQVIERIYEDFEYLEHCVITDQPYHGLIIPPLPYQVAVDAHSAEAYTKKHMGKGSKTLLGDDFKKKSFQLQRYLELLLSHPVLGRSPRLQEFLLNKDPPPKTKVRKGLISKLSATLEARKVSHPDCEDFFQRERENVAKYYPAIDEFAHNFNKIVYAQLKIMHQLEHMVVALKLNQCLSGIPPSYNGLSRLYLRCIDVAKNELEEKISVEDTRIGCIFDLWAKYVEAEEAMLLRRTSLMIDYQACNRALDKAKPNRKQAAESAKKESEELFERCSDDARREIKRFHHLRTEELQKNIETFVQYQLTYTRSSVTLLSSTLSKIKTVVL